LIRVEVFRSPDKLLQGFCVKGHAGFAPDGQDIVCSAVSSLTLAAAMGLSQVAGMAVEGGQKDGRLECRLAESPDQKSEMILATMLLGLQEIYRQYPKFIQIIDS
jgi:hypothetical protein